MVWVGRDLIDHLVPSPLPWAGTLIIIVMILVDLEQVKEAFPELREILRRTRLCCQWLVNHTASQGEGLALSALSLFLFKINYGGGGCVTAQAANVLGAAGKGALPSIPSGAPESPHHPAGTYLETDRQGVTVTLAPGRPAGTGSAAWPRRDAGGPGRDDKEKNPPPSARPPCPGGCPLSPSPLMPPLSPRRGWINCFFKENRQERRVLQSWVNPNCQDPAPETRDFSPSERLAPKQRVHPSPPPSGDAWHDRISLSAPSSLCASPRARLIDRAQVPAGCSRADLITCSPRGPNWRREVAASRRDLPNPVPGTAGIPPRPL